MRYRRLQFSLKMLLVLVTLSAVGVDYFRRREAMLKAAHRHLLGSIGMGMYVEESLWEVEEEALYTLEPPLYWSTGERIREPRSLVSLANRYVRLSAEKDYHERMRIKYERAAWFPWIPVNEESPDHEYFRDLAGKEESLE